MRLSQIFSLLAIATSLATARGEEPLSFNRDVRPILSDKCFFCHGPDKNKREADLRLDVREDAVAAEAIVPGDLEASEVYWRITAEDEDELMPPADSHKTLTDAEKNIVARWIEEGAEYQAHWAYLPVSRHEAPAKGSAAIDFFVDRRLKKAGLARSEEADEVTLLRRLHFDLTGLPPAPEDLDTFRQIGMEAYVDRLLASPHYGERMAIDWLDAVRYADTVGYHGDQPLEVSPFRDWVIAAFNENKPFDEFSIEQIAGDLLPNPTLDQQVAAAYNRLGQSSNEGGIQDAEYVAKYRAERVRTTSTAWLGSTLACAECHDHKFDPFTTKDFYEFGAFFADILEKGAWTGDGAYQEDPKAYERDGIVLGDRGPMLQVPTEEESARRSQLKVELTAARGTLNETTPELEAGAVRWAEEKQKAMAANEPADYVYLHDRGEKNEVETKGWTFVNRDQGPVHAGQFSRKQQAKELIQHIGNAKKKPLEIAAGDVLFCHIYLDPKNPPKQVMLQFHLEKDRWDHRAWWGEDVISFGGIGTDKADHRRMGELPRTGEWVRLEVPVDAVGLQAGDKITQFAFTQWGGLAYWDTSGIRTTSERYKWGDLPDEIRGLLSKAPEEISGGDRARLLEHYRSVAPELEPARNEVARLEGAIAALEKGMASVPATVSATRREVRVLPRGNWMDQTGEIVNPATPRFLPAAIESGKEPLTRLDLARWIVSPENPLSSRTFVNRLWARFFGNGISDVVDDLGSQGEWPTHPDLIDWLAAEFVESGWDVKHIVKTIVLSETYRQSSESSSDLQAKDPYNRLLARQSGIRLPAELVRDNALSVSGLLNPAIGGRSAKPYQPDGYYEHLNFPRRTYEADRDENQYRRGLYTHWQRTFLHPAMKAFDAPAREECTMERENSSTPLQALVLLNDPSYVEAAKSLAAGSEGPVDMFVKVLTRQPSEQEAAVLERLHEAEKARFQADPNHAHGLLTIGMSEVEANDAVALASRISVARAILNLHETITRY